MNEWFDKIWQGIIDNKSRRELENNSKTEKEILAYKEEIRNLKSDLFKADDEIIDLSEKLGLLEEAMKKPTVNINDFKKYYEDKKEKSIWKYPFNGDGKSRDVKYALSDSKSETKILRGAARSIIQKFALVSGCEPEEVIESVVKYFRIKSNWTYLSDSKNPAQKKKRDFWQRAGISWKVRVGDCEDISILMHNLIYYIFNTLSLSHHYWRLEFSAWILISNEGGHAQNTWLGSDGEWYIIESTYDLTGSFKRTWLKTPVRYNNLYAKPMGWARKDRSWKGSISSLENMRQIK